jgi:Fungal trichothecene efflux pump (TRI12)
LTTVIWGYWSTKFRTIRAPLWTGFLLLTAGIVGLATIEPGDSTNALVFAGLAGIGFGAPLIIIITGVQLSTPHHLIATATAVTTSSRAVAATVFTAIYAAAFSTRIDKKLPNYVEQAATKAGLAASDIPAFIKALTSQDNAALAAIPGVNPTVIGAAVAALKQAFADSVRVVYIIAVPFGVIACIACIFLGDMRKTMNYRIDAPVEDVTAKHHKGSRRPSATAV